MNTCIVCHRQQPTLNYPDRVMSQAINSVGESIYIHKHHRIMTIFRAGISLSLTKQKRSRSKRFYITVR